MKPSFRVPALAAAIVTALLSGCSTLGEQDTQLQAKLDALESQRQELLKRQESLNAQAAQIEQDRQNVAATAATAPENITMASASGLLPPNARPGECYSRIWQPPQYKTVSKRVVKREASERIEVIPAKFGKQQERVLVSEESTKLVVVPATYRYVEERIMVKPESRRLVTVPAVYETVTERVLDKPAHTVWKKGNNAGTSGITRIDESTGEVMCLVEVPASYKTVSKRVLKTAASTKEVIVPAVYDTVKKRVIDQEATTKTVVIPAKYETVTKTVELSPAEEKRIPVPEEWETVTSRELVDDGKMVWRSILCHTNATRDRIRSIQLSLKKRGFNPGETDGYLGPRTTSAVRRFQTKEGLPVDGLLTIDTVKALGIPTT